MNLGFGKLFPAIRHISNKIRPARKALIEWGEKIELCFFFVVSMWNSISGKCSTLGVIDITNMNAKAIASKCLSARSALSMRVRCHCQPSRLRFLNICSIQARNPYHSGSLSPGIRSVAISQGFSPSCCQHPRSVHSSRLFVLLNKVTLPLHCSPGDLIRLDNGIHIFLPSGLNMPPELIRKYGWNPMLAIVLKSEGE